MRRRELLATFVGCMLIIYGFTPVSSQVPIAQKEQIKIGGLFPLTGSLELGGKERNSAFLIAVNEINNDSNLLPNHILTPVTADTGTDPEIGLRAAENLIKEGVISLIGASSSSVSVAIAGGPSIVSKVPLISYSSTSPILSDVSQFPYFLRVVPSDILQINAIIDVVQAFDWDVISIIRSANIYGQGLSNQVDTSGEVGDISVGVSSLASQAELRNIDVIQNRAINNSEGIRDNLQQIKLFGSNVILLNVYLRDTIEIFETAADLDMTSQDGYVWLGTDSATQSEVFQASEIVNNAMQGFLGLKPLQPNITAYNTFLDLWQSCAGETVASYFGCGDRSPNIYAPFAYDAVYFLAETLDNMIELGLDYRDGDLLHSRLVTHQHDGVTGRIILNDVGDRLSGYDVVNLRGFEFAKVGTWELFSGFSQTSEVYWQGSHSSNTRIPTARVASSWLLLLSLIVLPLLIFGIRKLLEYLRRKIL